MDLLSTFCVWNHYLYQTSFRVRASRLTCAPPKVELFPTGTWGVSTWRRVRGWKIWWGLKMWPSTNYVKSKRFLWQWPYKSLPNREAMKAKGWLDIWFWFLSPGQDQNQTNWVPAVPWQAEKGWAPNFQFPEYVLTTLSGDQVTRLRSEILELLGT